MDHCRGTLEKNLVLNQLAFIFISILAKRRHCGTNSEVNANADFNCYWLVFAQQPVQERHYFFFTLIGYIPKREIRKSVDVSL